VWKIIQVGLKNEGAAYQMVMNLNFHDMVGKEIEVYIDDIELKSVKKEDHSTALQKAFERMQFHGLKLNSLKIVLETRQETFLGFLCTNGDESGC